MSNRVVSSTYRTVIDDVIANVRQDFEDMGIEKEVLDELQRSWEAKIVATGVADFEGAAPVAPRSKKQKEQNGTNSDATKKEGEDQSISVKKEDDQDPSSSNNKIAKTNGSSDVHGANGDVQATFLNGQYVGPGGTNVINGTSVDHANEDNAANKRKRPSTDENEIGSDLDDSDEDEMEGNVDADGNEDMILCLYDKVQRVRNKWKCILKDGVASIDGRDYVFSKLSSELEW